MQVNRDQVEDQVPRLIGLAFLAGIALGAQLGAPRPLTRPRPALPAPIAPETPPPWKICQCGYPAADPSDWVAHWRRAHADPSPDPLAELFP